MEILLLILLVLAAGVAFAFYLQFSALQKTDTERRRAVTAANEAQEKAKKKYDEIRAKYDRQRDDLQTARKQLKEVRQRAHKLREGERKQRSARDIELSETLEETRRFLDEERARGDALSRDIVGLEAELKKQREGVTRLEQALANARAAAERPVAAPLPPDVAEVVAEREKVEAELRGRIESLETQVREARRKAGDAEGDARKARGKTATLNRLHLLTKSELDLFKEKLVWSEKRVVELEKLLFANNIDLPEREAAPQPKPPKPAPALLAREEANTGGEGVVAEAVDYVPEGDESASTDVTAEQAQSAEGSVNAVEESAMSADGSEKSSDEAVTAEAAKEPSSEATESTSTESKASDESASPAAESASASEAAPAAEAAEDEKAPEAAESTEVTASSSSPSSETSEAAQESEPSEPSAAASEETEEVAVAAGAEGVQPVRRPRAAVEERKAAADGE